MTLRPGILAAVLVLAVCASAQAEIIERVVAVVNEDAIFLSDLRKRAVPFLPRLTTIESEAKRLALLDDLYDQLLTGLIEEELFRQTANRLGIRVSVDDVELAIKNIQQQNNLTNEQFWDAISEQGMEPTQYRKDLRRQLIRYKVINERVRSRVNVTEDEVRRTYDAEARATSKSFSFRVSHILMPIAADASTTDVAKMRARVTNVHSATTQDNFARQIEKYGGGELGWLKQGDLDETLEETLLTMQPGEVSKPIRGKGGYHIFLLHEREAGGDIAPYDARKEEIFRKLYDEAIRKQERVFVNEMKRKAAITRML